MVLQAAIGLAAGIGGTCAGHWAVLAAHWLTGDANIWLKGPHGPPFFDLCLSTGAYFAVLGAALLGRRAAAGLKAGGVAFALFAIPMTASTYLFTWGEDPAQGETLAWMYLVMGVYSVANLGGAAAAGWLAWGRRSALFAALGAAVAAAVQYFLAYMLAANALPTPGFLPPSFAVYSGALWGFFIALSIEWTRPKVEPPSIAAAPMENKEAQYA